MDPNPIGGTDYIRLGVSDLSFTQTFTDTPYSNRTLHNNTNFFEQSNIKKANPATFEFTLNLVEEANYTKVLERLLDLTADNKPETFTLWFVDSRHNSLNFYITDCVFTSGTFVIEKLAPLALTLTGEGSKLQEIHNTQAYSLKLSAGDDLDNVTYQSTKKLEIIVDGTDISQGVVATTIELQNEIKWQEYQTVNDALNVTDESNTMYPSNFTLEKRTLAGSITRFISSSSGSMYEDPDVDTWQTNKSISIKAGNSLTKGVQLELSNCTFTNRVNPGAIYTSSYDWRMNDNPSNLGSIIKFNNLTS